MSTRPSDIVALGEGDQWITAEPPRPGIVRTDKVVVDVSTIATEAFGHRSIEYWGTLSFMLVEGFTMLLVIASYFYLVPNSETWPPPGIMDPAPLWFILCAATMIAACIPMHFVCKAAERLDEAGVKRHLAIALALALAAAVFRFLSFEALHVKWYDSAYGSAAWNILGFHSALLLPDIADVAIMATIFWRRYAEPKHYVAVVDTALSWYFVTFTGIVSVLVIVLAPRLL